MIIIPVFIFMLLAVADPEIGGRAMILPLSSFCPFPALPSIPVQSSPLNLTGRSGGAVKTPLTGPGGAW